MEFGVGSMIVQIPPKFADIAFHFPEVLLNGEDFCFQSARPFLFSVFMSIESLIRHIHGFDDYIELFFDIFQDDSQLIGCHNIKPPGL
jgi:hypothetical protein